MLTDEGLHIFTPPDLCFRPIYIPIEGFIVIEYLITLVPPYSFGVVEEVIYGVLLNESWEIQLTKPIFNMLP